ncbi:MAG TPA: hypothetical protein VG842_06685, partial [Sediminibacterium sp.]|nr:hypothetical protein [Sediminibacterium sp.]
ERLKIDPGKLVIDPVLYRPAEITDLYGNNTETRSVLQWNYDINFFDVLDLLVEEELKND